MCITGAYFFTNGLDRSWSQGKVLYLAVHPVAPAGAVVWPEGSDRVGLYWTNPNDSHVTGYESRSVLWGGSWGAWQAVSGSNRHTTAHTVTGLSSGSRYGIQLRAKDANRAGPHVEAGPIYLPATPPSKLAVALVLANGTTAAALTETNLHGARIRLTPKGAYATGSGAFAWGTGADAGADISHFTVGGLAGASRSGTLGLPAGLPNAREVPIAYTGNLTADGTLRVSFTRASSVLAPAAPGWAEVTVHAQPQPTAAALTSTPAAARGYDVGETLTATVTFSYPVAVTGTPRLALTVGGRTRYAAYHSRSADKRTLTFAYAVVLNDEDGDGVAVAADALGLDGGSIVRDGVAGAAAVLALPGALGAQSGHKVAAGRGDYDRDDDGLIEVASVAQLNALRWDLDGDGAVDARSSGYNAAYVAAYPRAVAGMGCPSPGGCRGYELDAPLDLGGVPYGTGQGWAPIGSNNHPSRAPEPPFEAVFRGNGHPMSNLYLNRRRDYSGLFGTLGPGGRIEGVGLVDAEVAEGSGAVGALVGLNQGTVSRSYVTGSVVANVNVGGLVGSNHGVVEDSYSAASVHCRQGHAWSGGGGLVGTQWGGRLRRGYAVGAVTGACGSKGGLVFDGTVEAGYYDVEAAGVRGGAGEAKTARALKGPVGSTGPYATWSATVWAFGTEGQLPVLVAGGHRAAAQHALQGRSPEAALASLALAPGTLAPAFAATVSAYGAAVGHEVAQVTVTAAPAHSLASVAVTPADADPEAAGHQVALAVGGNAVALTVTAEDGTARGYAVAVTRARAPGLVVGRSVGLAEGGEAAYPVALAAAPGGAVTVTAAVAPGGSPEVSVSPPSLVFAQTTWAVAQTVTVRAAADADAAPDTATVRHRASGGGYGAVAADVAVSVADDDAPGLVLGRPSLAVAEGGEATYTVRLAAAPGGAVTVTAAVASGGSPDVAVSPPSLVFAQTTWAVAQTVTVRAAADADAAPDTATVRHRASGGGYGAVAADVAVSVVERERPGVVLGRPGLTVAEGGEATYTVRLAAAPGGAMTVTAAVAPGGSPDVSVSPAALAFTPATWAVAQTVTVRAVADDDAVADTARVRHRAGAGYGAAEAGLAVAVAEGDRPGLVLGERSLAVDEGGCGDLHGGAGGAAHRAGAGGGGAGGRGQPGRGRVPVVARLRPGRVGYGADGDGARRGRRRRGGGRGHGGAHRDGGRPRGLAGRAGGAGERGAGRGGRPRPGQRRAHRGGDGGAAPCAALGSRRGRGGGPCGGPCAVCGGVPGGGGGDGVPGDGVPGLRAGCGPGPRGGAVWGRGGVGAHRDRGRSVRCGAAGQRPHDCEPVRESEPQLLGAARGAGAGRAHRGGGAGGAAGAERAGVGGGAGGVERGGGGEELRVGGAGAGERERGDAGGDHGRGVRGGGRQLRGGGARGVPAGEPVVGGGRPGGMAGGAGAPELRGGGAVG